MKTPTLQLFPEVDDVLRAASSLLPNRVRLLTLEKLSSRYKQLASHREVQVWEPDSDIRRLTGWNGSGFLPAFLLRGGPARLLLIASPHADEPVGVASALAVLEGLLLEKNRWLRDRVSVAVVPLANPAGYAANERWLASANALEAVFEDSGKPTRERPSIPVAGLDDPRVRNAAGEYLGRYLACRRRSLPQEDVEFGYGPPGANPHDEFADFLPPCRAHAAFYGYLLERWGGLDVAAPLHSMGVAGGAWALLRVPHGEKLDDSTRRMMVPYERAASETGLGLHDEDRGGEKGFWRLGPGFHTTPTAEEMRAFFEESGAEVTIRYNSVQYIGDRSAQACIPEVPLFFDADLRDDTLIDRPRGAVWRDRARVSEECARQLEGVDDEQVAAYRSYWKSNARAFSHQAATSGEDEQARRREEARARVDAVARPTLTHALAAEAREEEPDMKWIHRMADRALIEWNLRPVPLRVQVYLQLVLAFSALRA